MLEIILLQGFCPLRIKITQFPNGIRLNHFCIRTYIQPYVRHYAVHWTTLDFYTGITPSLDNPLESEVERRGGGGGGGGEEKRKLLFSFPSFTHGDLVFITTHSG